MTDLYILTEGSYSDESPVAAFSSLAKAQGQFAVNQEWTDCGDKGKVEGPWLTYVTYDVKDQAGNARYTHTECYAIYRLPLDEDMKIAGELDD